MVMLNRLSPKYLKNTGNGVSSAFGMFFLWIYTAYFCLLPMGAVL